MTLSESSSLLGFFHNLTFFVCGQRQSRPMNYLGYQSTSHNHSVLPLNILILSTFSLFYTYLHQTTFTCKYLITNHPTIPSYMYLYIITYLPTLTYAFLPLPILYIPISTFLPLPIYTYLPLHSKF